MVGWSTWVVYTGGKLTIHMQRSVPHIIDKMLLILLRAFNSVEISSTVAVE